VEEPVSPLAHTLARYPPRYALGINPGLVNGFAAASSFYHSVGVNSHATYPAYDPTRDGRGWAVTIGKIQNLGVLHLRETLFAPISTNGPYSWELLNALVGTGIKCLLGPAQSWGQQSPTGHFTVSDWYSAIGTGMQMAYDNKSYPRVNPSVIDGISMPNEPPAGIENDLHAWQLDLKKQTLMRYPSLPIVGIVCLSGSNGQTQAGNLAAARQDTYGASPTSNGPTGVVAVTDVIDAHPYRGGTSTSTAFLIGSDVTFSPLTCSQIYGTGNSNPDSIRSQWKPMFASEAGYISFPNGSPQPPYDTWAHLGDPPTGYSPGFGQPPVPDAVKAEYTLRTLLHHYYVGIRRTYLDEFMDQGIDQGATVNGTFYSYFYSSDWFGLCDVNLNARGAFTAVKNLLAIVGDTAQVGAPMPKAISSVTGFSPTADYVVPSGEHIPDQLGYFVLGKNDGTYLIFIWRTVNLWNRDAFTVQTPAAQNLTVTQPGMNTAAYCNPRTSNNPTNSLTVSSAGTNSANVTVPVGGDSVCIHVT
jgi:hypothetical protein